MLWNKMYTFITYFVRFLMELRTILYKENLGALRISLHIMNK